MSRRKRLARDARHVTAFLLATAIGSSALAAGDACTSSANDCCEATANGTPGCSDATCCVIVCAVDSFCCSMMWDALCAEQADQLCGLCESTPAECGVSTVDCCVGAWSIAGCSDEACCTAGCGVDPSCCETAWDFWCAGLANELCASCTVECGDAGHDCWTSGASGCDDVACCEAVCAYDPPCCSSSWDNYCVWGAMTTCGTPPGTCGAAGHSVYVIGGPGGDEVACCEQVCGGDPSCCITSWDNGCVGLALAWCDPPLGVCGAARHGCNVTGGPGCDDAFCCEAVCTFDAFCCATEWDAGCVSSAAGFCSAPLCTLNIPPRAWVESEPCGANTNGGCEPTPEGESSCCYPNGTWFCDNYECFQIVNFYDAFCACVEWDQICAEEAALFCPDLCTLGPVAFEPIACGVTLHGTLWKGENGLTDTDWYEFTTEARSNVTVTVEATAAIEFGIAETDGVPTCAYTEFDPKTTVSECSVASISRCLEPGTHRIRLRPTSGPSYICGLWRSDYLITIQCEPDCEPGDPLNDTCETAIPISLGATTVDTTDASNDPLTIIGCPLQSMSKDLWFSFTAPSTGVVRFSTCNGGDVISRMMLFSGSCDALSVHACGDESFDCQFGGGSLEAAVDAGERYLLRVGTLNVLQGAATIWVGYYGCDDAYEVAEYTALPSGQIAGRINGAGVSTGRTSGKAFRWSPETGFTQITTPNQVGTGFDISSAGTVVGMMQTNTSNPPLPFIATGTSGTALPLPAGTTSGSALAVNDAGVIVGEAGSKAVQWVGGAVSVLALPLGPSSSARDINEAGVICGYMGSTTLGMSRGFVLDNGTVTEIPAPTGQSTDAVAINASGQVVGTRTFANPNGGTLARAFRWSNGVMTTIEPIAPFTSTRAIAIGDDGTVIGSLTSNVFFAWNGGQIVLLSNLVAFPENESPESLGGINAAGQISAIMRRNAPSGTDPAFTARLTPKPVSDDLDCDGLVDAVDLAVVLGAWGTCEFAAPCAADVNHDGVVDAVDLSVVLGAWNG